MEACVSTGWFTLCIDNFGIKYIGKENAKHLLNALRNNYKIEVNWTGSLYCGVHLTWHYDYGYLDTAIPGYVLESCKQFGHTCPNTPQDCPYEPAPKRYGPNSQTIDEEAVL